MGRPASCGARRCGESRLYSHRSQAEGDKQPAREDAFGECAVERVRGLQNASCCPGPRGRGRSGRALHADLAGSWTSGLLLEARFHWKVCLPVGVIHSAVQPVVFWEMNGMSL